MLYIYDLNINSVEFCRYPANSTQTIEDQKLQGRRPHISLQKLFVEEKNLTPDIIFDIRRCRKYMRGTPEYNRVFREE